MNEKPKILIVDDKTKNIIAIEKLLKQFDAECIRATTGSEALKFVLKHEFTLALVDVQMPEMDGFELVELMHQHEKTAFLPVIFISAVYSENYYNLKGRNTGAIDFITKPIIPEILTGKVSIFLELFRQKKALENEVSHRKEAEEKIQAALKEKELLMIETNHRVKNNFAILSSLISLQLNSLKDEKSQRVLRDVQSRLNTMSIIHEKLYKSDDINHIDFSKHLHEISVDLHHAFVIHPENIILKTDLENVYLNIKQIVPCCLIVTEILTNSFKYAFPDSSNKKGEVFISLHNREDNIIELIMSDNGVGLPEDIDMKNTRTLGLRLIPDFTLQIRGKCEVEKMNGTKYTITFPAGSDF